MLPLDLVPRRPERSTPPLLRVRVLPDRPTCPPRVLVRVLLRSTLPLSRLERVLTLARRRLVCVLWPPLRRTLWRLLSAYLLSTVALPRPLTRVPVLTPIWEPPVALRPYR